MKTLTALLPKKFFDLETIGERKEYLRLFIRGVIPPGSSGLANKEDVETALTVDLEIQEMTVKIDKLRHDIRQAKCFRKEVVDRMVNSETLKSCERLFLYWTFRGITKTSQCTGWDNPVKFSAVEVCSCCGDDITYDVKIKNWTALDYFAEYPTRYKKYKSLCEMCRGKKINEERDEADMGASDSGLPDYHTLENLKAMPYLDYLQSNHWQQVRERKLKQSLFRCQLCNSSDNLNVHHRTYERRGQEWDEDLTVLCRDCHARYHGKGY